MKLKIIKCSKFGTKFSTLIKVFFHSAKLKDCSQFLMQPHCPSCKLVTTGGEVFNTTVELLIGMGESGIFPTLSDLELLVLPSSDLPPIAKFWIVASSAVDVSTQKRNFSFSVGLLEYCWNNQNENWNTPSKLPFLPKNPTAVWKE